MDNKILIFGGTGYLGTYLVKACIKLGHQTFVYARPITPQSSPHKIDLHHEFRSLGVTVIEGELDEHEKIVATLRQVDIVISSLPFPQVPDQIHIIEAIKVAGNIKRFIPLEFGVEEDRLSFLPPFEACLDKKLKIRRAVEACGIPYTYISANCFVLFNYKEDIAEYTIKLANDPRTCNRIVFYRTPENVLSQIELVSLWEKKTGRSFRKTLVQEEELLKLTENLAFPDNVRASLHSIFVKGDLNYDLGEDDLETWSLNPDYKYTTMDQPLDIFLIDPPKPAIAAF
ncbi:Eugenol synthase 1 [Hibiscus syriacus]|uniref:Eugenol synthase 1 n=1 Tax=Hibiscus syriacus TaxID=106335 RepID=A0A6A2Z6L5_HIBSY|nr:Eugenol synthase 1 [Hibiscus syriacus]